MDSVSISRGKCRCVATPYSVEIIEKTTCCTHPRKERVRPRKEMHRLKINDFSRHAIHTKMDPLVDAADAPGDGDDYANQSRQRKKRDLPCRKSS